MDGAHLKIPLGTLKTVDDRQVRQAVAGELYRLATTSTGWEKNWKVLLTLLLDDFETIMAKVWEEARKCGNPDYPGSGVSVLCVQIKLPPPPAAWKGVLAWEQDVRV